MAVAFDCVNDLAAHSRSNLDRNPDSNKPSKDYFEGHTNRNSEVAVTLVVESLKEGLRNDSDSESCGH